MKGSIRILLGLLIVFGAVGGMDAGTATLTETTLLSVIGLGLMYWGTEAAKKV